jgi:hypothetical protein
MSAATSRRVNEPLELLPDWLRHVAARHPSRWSSSAVGWCLHGWGPRPQQPVTSFRRVGRNRGIQRREPSVSSDDRRPLNASPPYLPHSSPCQLGRRQRGEGPCHGVEFFETKDRTLTLFGQLRHRRGDSFPGHAKRTGSSGDRGPHLSRTPKPVGTKREAKDEAYDAEEKQRREPIVAEHTSDDPAGAPESGLGGCDIALGGQEALSRLRSGEKAQPDVTLGQQVRSDLLSQLSLRPEWRSSRCGMRSYCARSI